MPGCLLLPAVFLLVPLCWWLARIQTEEEVHVAPILLQRLDQEPQVRLPSIRDRIHPPCRASTAGGVPLGLAQAVLFHLSQDPVKRARVHRLEPERCRLLHE